MKKTNFQILQRQISCALKNGLAIFSATSLLLASGGVTTFASQTAEGSPTENPILTCTPADEWTALFDRKGCSGWLGADGIYSVSVDGNDSIGSATSETKTFFIFSDTLMGTADRSGRVTKTLTMPNHSSALLTGDLPDADNLTFVYGYKGKTEDTRRVNLFNSNQWLFDCFQLGDAIYLTAFSQQDWKPVQIDLIRIPIVNGEVSYAGFTRTRNVKELICRTETVHYDYGMGVLNHTSEAGVQNADGYIYIYGYMDQLQAFSRKDLIVSRIAATDFPDFTKLTYWDGEKWGSEITESAAILENVSCEVSVTPITGGPYKGKYIAVYTEGVQTAHMKYAIGDSPAGPFDTPVEFYTAPESGATAKGGNGTLYTYNAKAHPHLSKDGKLLISYNVNDSYGLAGHTYDYHPRFLYLDLMYSEDEIKAVQSEGAVTTAPIPSVSEPIITDSLQTSDGNGGGKSNSGGSVLPIVVAGGTVLAVGVAAWITVGVLRKRKSKRN